jgi:transcriptional regulator with XRE-family HTH domain
VSREKTHVQEALVAMRGRLNLTQQQLAIALKVATVTVGRWESIRSPTGSSLTALASFAHEAGDEESAKIFHQAAFPKAIHIDLARSEAETMALAPEVALRQIRGHIRNPAVKAEYVKVLRALLRAHQVLTYQAVESLKGKSEFYADLALIAPAQQNLRKELNEQQGKKTKPQR